MSSAQQPPNEPRGLEGSVESMVEVEDGVNLVVRLRNPLDRALHYISDVRGMIFDPTTNRLQVRLSERGLQTPLTSIPMQPRFRVIDPRSEALITIKLPETIVKLTETPTPTGDARFQEYRTVDATSIEVDIAWAETPYYPDPREASRTENPFTSWEQDSLRISFRGGIQRGAS
jgi:hypothetical protein